jgi:hypothetical protein
VSLRSDRGVETQLPAVQGSLNLPVLPPFSLRLEPAPAVGSVRWNGQPLAPATAAGQSLDPTSGQGQAQFLYPPPAAASRPRP